jgi:hypothetical protein
MNDDDAGIEGRPQDEFVARRRPTPGDGPPEGIALAGFLGDSDRAGYRRLYLSRDLSRHVEFPTTDVLEVRDVAPDERPFVGDAATEVRLRDGANIDFTQRRTTHDLEFGFLPPDPGGWRGLGGADDSDGCYSRRYYCVHSRYCAV